MKSAKYRVAGIAAWALALTGATTPALARDEESAKTGDQATITDEQRTLAGYALAMSCLTTAAQLALKYPDSPLGKRSDADTERWKRLSVVLAFSVDRYFTADFSLLSQTSEVQKLALGEEAFFAAMETQLDFCEDALKDLPSFY